MKMWEKIIPILVVGVVGVGGYAIWQKSKPAENRYRTESVEFGDLTKTVSANGTLNPVVLVNVGTQVSGTVKKLYADFNDTVKAGQVLMDLDPAIYAAQVKQSEANVKNAAASVELAAANEARMRNLYAQEYASKQDLDQATQALKSARAQLDLAQAQLLKDRTNLDYTIIRSPVSGVVVSREVDVGQTVAATFQTPTLFKIAQDLKKMQIDSSFAEADIGNIKVGQTVHFNVDAFPNRSFQGTVSQVRLNPTTLQNVVTYDVVVSVDNAEMTLMPGMTAYVNIVVAKSSHTLLLPNAALRFKPEGREGKRDRKEKGVTVYALEGEKLKAVKVQPGITDNRFTEIVSGDLKPGDRVVVEDMKVSAIPGQPPGTMRARMF